MKIDEYFIKQAFAELRDAQGQALALLTQAICQQIDPAKLTGDLKKTIAAAKQMPSISSIAIDHVTQAQAAAQAEVMLQAKPPAGADRPK